MCQPMAWRSKEFRRSPFLYLFLIQTVMPLDHYVSQVHLRRFYSSALGNRMHATRKADLKYFTPDSESVCRVMDGSTNTYLLKDRVIEEFLKRIEPNYNPALEQLSAGRVDSNCIYTIAGFVAYVVTCSPAGMRIQSMPLKRMLEHQAVVMDAQEAFPPSPAELGGARLPIFCVTDVSSSRLIPNMPSRPELLLSWTSSTSLGIANGKFFRMILRIVHSLQATIPLP